MYNPYARWIVFSICLDSYFQLEVKNISLDKLGLQNNYNDIVRDLIKNWDSPIVYLRQLGYLPNNYEDTSRIKPNLDELISRMEGDSQKSLFRHEQVEKIIQKRHNVMKHVERIKKESMEPNKPQAPQSVIEKKSLPTMNKVLAMKQPVQPVSESKVQQVQQQLDRQHVQPLNMVSLDRALAKQQTGLTPTGLAQPQPVEETVPLDPSDNYLKLLVARTSPKQAPQAMRAAQVPLAPKLAIAPAKAVPKTLVNVAPIGPMLSMLPDQPAKVAAGIGAALANGAESQSPSMYVLQDTRFHAKLVTHLLPKN